MKIAIRYQSRGGNTKAVAEVIANITGVKAESIEVPLNEPVDLLFIGGGVYAWYIDRVLKDYLETLEPSIVKSIAAFSTGGAMSATRKIAEIAQTKNITVCEKDLSIKMGTRNYHLFGGSGTVTLSDKQLSLIDGFVKSLQR